MRRTAFILAGAAIFDLGVMAVSAQAQQAGPASRVSTPDGHSASGGEPVDAAPRQAATVDYFLKLSAAYPARSCTAARGQVVTHEGVQQCRLPGPPQQGDRQAFRIEGHVGATDDAGGASTRRSGPGATGADDDFHKQGVSLNFTKIDMNHTARACIAQRGEVVTHEGVPQCAAPGPATASPARERRSAAPAVARE
jgi:hypothetical protein